MDGNSLGLPHWWLAYVLAPNHLQVWSIAAAFCERPRGIVTCSQQTWWEASGAPGFAMSWGAGCVSQVVWRGTTQLIPLMNSRGLFLETSTWICFTDTLGTSAAMTYVHCQTSCQREHSDNTLTTQARDAILAQDPLREENSATAACHGNWTRKLPVSKVPLRIEHPEQGFICSHISCCKPVCLNRSANTARSGD